MRFENRPGRKQFPSYAAPEGETREGYLERLCYEGLERRFGERAKEPALRERLAFELDVLKKTGFTSYFLIVWDFIHYAKTHDIPVGPGRGSAAGSLISYVLGITDLDPLKYGLFFERFLNPERISPPDIDVDFCYNRRPEVIEYVRKKYGEKSVAQIITFGTLGAKMAIRDVGRVMGLSYGEADRLTKMIPFDPKMTLDKALEDSADFKRAYDEEDIARSVIDSARTLEGVSRQAGVHAAGVVISDRDLTDYVPLTKDDHDGIVTQYSMEPLGELGLLKMDFLGLENADRDRGRAEADRADDRPEDDAARNSARRSRRLRLDEPRGKRRPVPGGIAGHVRRVPANPAALRRGHHRHRRALPPRPMEFIPLYANRKSGKVPLEYDHPLLEPILKETYGIMVYRRGIMQAAQILAGYTLGGADMLRRAMAKRRPRKWRSSARFSSRAAPTRNKIAEKKANDLFDVLDKFAGYGFNKAHAACYGVITCQTAWLKAKHPVEFMAALLSNELDNTDKIALFIAEAKRMGIQVLGPSVNQSGSVFTVGENMIRFGMSAIKNVGQAAVQLIIAAREKDGPFRDLHDLCARVESRGMNKKAAREPGQIRRVRRIRSEPRGAADPDRRRAGPGERQGTGPPGWPGLAARSSRASEPISKKSKSQASANTAPDFSLRERLAYEKELLGFYITGHPLDDYTADLAAFQIHTVAQVKDTEGELDTRVCGLVTKVDVRPTQKDKKPWARVTFEDSPARSKCSCSRTCTPRCRARSASAMCSLSPVRSAAAMSKPPSAPRKCSGSPRRTSSSCAN